MRAEIDNLKERYRNAKNEAEMAEIDAAMDKLSSVDNDAFSNAMMDSIKDSVAEAEELLLRDKLKSILPAISVSYIAKNYFGHTPMWFYQRLNGNIVHGKKVKFSESELDKLRAAMIDIGEKIKAAALVF